MNGEGYWHMNTNFLWPAMKELKSDRIYLDQMWFRNILVRKMGLSKTPPEK